MTKIIARNTTVPTKKSEVFSTAVDNQPNVEIHVLQGEREFTRDNKSLGTFRLDGIMSAPRGVPQIEVTFDIDANGILSVTAKDKGTGKEQSITITGASTLPKEEVEQLVKEAQENADLDQEKRRKIDLKNNGDSAVYQAEKQISELGDKISSSDKQDIDIKIQDLKQALQDENYEAIESTQSALQKAIMEIGKKTYDQTSKGSNAQQDAEETVIDTKSKEA